MIPLYNTEEALKQDIGGRHFIYMSKYGGEVHGTVKDVVINYNGSLKRKAYKPVIWIVSDFGVLYRMDEIHFTER